MYRKFGVPVASWGSYKASTMLRRHSWSNGRSFRLWLPLQRHHSVNHDITGLAKYHPEKQIS